jgi:sec-independent protein translocase protein TatB
MFDLAWSEIAVIAVVALVVIGPKDLPRVLRTVGTWVGKARAIAREFQGSLDQMIREAELEDVRKQVESAASFDVGNAIEKTIDPAGDLKRGLSEPLLPEPAAKPAEPPALPPSATVPEPEIVPETTPAPPRDATVEPASTPAKSDTHA